MRYPQKIHILQMVIDRLFLKLDPQEIIYLRLLEWDDLMRYIGKKYGVSLQVLFEECLIDVLRIENQKEKLEK